MPATDKTVKYKLIFFAGPGNKESFEQVQQAFAEKKKQGYPCVIIGDGVNNITLAMINEKLNKDNIAPDAWIGLNFHGGRFVEHGIVGDSQIEVGKEFSHCIEMRTEEDAKPVLTKALFELLTQIIDSKDLKDHDSDIFQGLQIHLYSCHGGAAVKDYDKLPVNSVLFTHSSSEFPTPSAQCTRDMVASITCYPNHPFDEFAQAIPKSAVTTTIHAAYSWKKTQDGKEIQEKQVLHHTARPPATPVTINVETARYLQRSIADYQKKLAPFDHTLPPITISEELASLYHQEHCLIQLNNDDENFVKAYVTKEGVPPSVLNKAIVKGKTELVEFMLQASAVLTPTATNDITPPLILAIKSNQTAIVDLLLKKAGVDPNFPSGSLFPLCLAFYEKNIPIMRALLEAGADHSVNGYDGIPLFHDAVFSNNEEIVDIFLKAGADANSSSTIGTPLILAILNDPLNTKLVKALIDAGADVNKVDKEGFTPLHYAAQLGYSEIAKALLEAGADITAEVDGKTAQQLAEEAGKPETARYLAQEALLHAIKTNDPQRARNAINSGADANQVDKEVFSPLRRAGEKDARAVAKVLLDAGADFSIEVGQKASREFAKARNNNPAIGKHTTRLKNEGGSPEGPAHTI